MTNKTERLIKDLAILFVKYSVSDWKPILSVMSAGGAHSALVRAIERQLETTSKARVKRPKPKAQKRDARQTEIVSGPETSPQLRTFEEALIAKRALPTARDLRMGAELLGIKEDLPADRRRGITKIIAHLTPLGHEALTTALARVAEAHIGSQHDRGAEYARWAALIMN